MKAINNTVKNMVNKLNSLNARESWVELQTIRREKFLTSEEALLEGEWGYNPDLPQWQITTIIDTFRFRHLLPNDDLLIWHLTQMLRFGPAWQDPMLSILDSMREYTKPSYYS